MRGDETQHEDQRIGGGGGSQPNGHCVQDEVLGVLRRSPLLQRRGG